MFTAQWLLAKEDAELDAMRGQSSSWFFIEELAIGAVSVNVTLSLTSSLDLSGQGVRGRAQWGLWLRSNGC